MTEWEVDVQTTIDGIYQGKAAENLNRLLEKIHKSCKCHDEQYLVLLDELTADLDGHDFSQALHGISKLIVLMALNPAAYGCTKELNIVSPSKNNIISCRLLTRHRNAFGIANLVAHFNQFLEREDDPYKCISTSEDHPLDINTMAVGSLPIWIKKILNLMGKYKSQ